MAADFPTKASPGARPVAETPPAPVLSVLVPVFNWDVSALILRLVEEADAARLWGRVELLVLDDASTDPAVSAANDALFDGLQRPGLECGRLERNAGRSAIRNLLAARAKGEFLLFLDCDVLPDGPDFLRGYLGHAEAGELDVVCGGVSYRTRVMREPEYDYHAYLGGKKEVKNAAQRNQTPWRHILTSNIMVRKAVFQSTPFDERFIGYGYEDIEWGVRLSRRYRILHIDNTASHLGLVSKARAYQKMCDSVPNYLLLRELAPEAFAASSISRVVGLLVRWPRSLLRCLDFGLSRGFLVCRNNRIAFLLFQLDFAVLLACGLKARTGGRG